MSSSFSPKDMFTPDTCTACGICSKICPVGAITCDSQGKPESFSSLCIRCGHCGCYCPVNCYSLETANEFHNDSLEGELDSLFKNRRSVRSFTSRVLSEDHIKNLLSPVGYSPTGHNDQGIQVDVISSRERIDKHILKPFIRLLKIVDCFRLLTLLAGPGRGLLKRLKNGEDLITWGAPCVLIFRVSGRNVTPSDDALIAASAVATKAETMGLGVLWNGVIKGFAPVIGLGRCRAVLCVGYPAFRKYQSIPERNWSRRDL